MLIGDSLSPPSLFVASLPKLIAQTNMDSQSVARLRDELNQLLHWLANFNQVEKYLSTPYENQTAEYQEKVSFFVSPFLSLCVVVPYQLVRVLWYLC